MKVVGTIEELSGKIRIDLAIPKLETSKEEDDDNSIKVGFVWSSHTYDHVIPFGHERTQMDLPKYIPDKFHEFIKDLETCNNCKLDIELICSGDEYPMLLCNELEQLHRGVKYSHVEIVGENALSKYIDMDLIEIHDLLNIDREEFMLPSDLVDISTYTFQKQDTTYILEGMQNHHFIFHVDDRDIVIDGRNCTLVLPDSVTTLYGLYNFVGSGSITLQNMTIIAPNVNIAPSCGLFVHYGRSSTSMVRFENCHISVKSIGIGGGAFVGSGTQNIHILNSSCDVRSLMLPYSGGLVGSFCKDMVIKGTTIHFHRGIMFPQVGGMIGYCMGGDCSITDSHLTVDGNIQGSFVGGIIAPCELVNESETFVRIIDSCSVHIRGRDGAGGDSFGGIVGTMTTGWSISNSEVTIDGDLYGCKSGGMTGFGSKLDKISNCHVMVVGGITGQGSGGLTGSTTTIQNIDNVNVVIMDGISGERSGGLCGYNVRIQQCVRSCHVDISGSITGDHCAGIFGAKPIIKSIDDCHVEVHGDVTGIESAVVVGYRSRIQECFSVWCHVYGSVDGAIIFGSEYSSMMKRSPLYIWAIIDGKYNEDFANRISIISGTNDANEQLLYVSNSGRQHLLSTFSIKEVTIESKTMPVYQNGETVATLTECAYLNIFKPDHCCNIGPLRIGYSECTYSRPKSIEMYDLDYSYGGVIISSRKSVDTIGSTNGIKDSNSDTDVDVVYKHDSIFEDYIEDAKHEIVNDHGSDHDGTSWITWIIVAASILLVLLLVLWYWLKLKRN
ncbi:hypothetical protein N9C24_04925 [Gammaproteobacteria bacterium]|nr:hypothetical protein [Gammaproteobacteria bacterium]